MRAIALVLTAFILSVSVSGQGGIDVNDTRLLSDPAISQDHIAFAYGGDLWVAGLDGGNVRRLTSHPGPEGRPAFSPDGKLIAFTGQYDGNTDVFVVDAGGGIPKRLTWHPGRDYVQGFTPDGKSVLFTSPRAVFNNRYEQLFTVPVSGDGPEAPVVVPNAHRGAFSPDGSRIAYNPLGTEFDEWKHYRGGTVSTLSIFRLSDYSVEKVPQPAGRCNDPDPMWMGDTLYFRSDRNGEFNLFSYDPKSRAVRQLTNHADFPVISAAAAAGKIVYEQAGYLHMLDVRSGKSARLKIGVPSDLPETRPRFVKGFRYVRDFALSPSAARVALEFRGEIVTIPAEKGDPRNLTHSTAAHEHSPAWSPDGKSIAYFSDESGEYELHVRGQDGKGEVKKFKPGGAGYYDDPLFSPDSRKISFADNSLTLYWIDLDSGAVKKIASEHHYGPALQARIIHNVWSPDSKWIVYTLSTQTNIQTVYAYSLEQDKSTAVTDGLSEVSEPVFDASGKYLYFFGSTDAGPVKQWFDLSSADMRETQSIYLAVLRKDLPSPLVKESDEEKGAAKEDRDKDKEKEKSKEAANPAGTEPVVMDFDGIQNRILALPLKTGNYSNLRAGAAGTFYYLEVADPPASDTEDAPAGTIHKYDLNKRKDDVQVTGAASFEISADGKKLLYTARDAAFIVPAAEKPEPGKGKLNIDAVEVRIDPRAEWPQIFNEAWRINRDYFYDPNMHGADWPAMRQKYSAFLPHLATRNDLNRAIQWMCSELVVGHHRVGGGDSLYQPKNVPGGLLGADYSIENGRYRFKKVYGGLNWNPDLRSPLTEPGVDVRTGEYLISVQGAEVRPPANLYSFFENTSGKAIEITVGLNADGSGSRTVTIVPIADEAALRNRDWVEGNIRKVDLATGGRVAYVYVPDTGGRGHAYFKRYFYPQSWKEAIIVDERFNGGGLIADYYIDRLRRPFVANWATRYGADLKTPTASIEGPKVMIIDETAGSGGDLLPWMFRKFKLGTIVGKRTWGGLVGILGFPVLMDGGRVTAPNLAIWVPDGGWVVENEGVPPDIEVEQTPADVIAGRDPQLEKAIELVLAQLKQSPPPQRPPYRGRTRTSRAE